MTPQHNTVVFLPWVHNCQSLLKNSSITQYEVHVPSSAQGTLHSQADQGQPGSHMPGSTQSPMCVFGCVQGGQEVTVHQPVCKHNQSINLNHVLLGYMSNDSICAS